MTEQAKQPTISNPVEAVVVCKCQDSTGEVCGRIITKEEDDQDGMCWHCADNVWNEMTSNKLSGWNHSDRIDSDYT